MGLLTDPRAGNGELAKFVLKWEMLLCYLLYFSGMIWTVLLAVPYFNDSTYEYYCFFLQIINISFKFTAEF